MSRIFYSLLLLSWQQRKKKNNSTNEKRSKRPIQIVWNLFPILTCSLTDTLVGELRSHFIVIIIIILCNCTQSIVQIKASVNYN